MIKWPPFYFPHLTFRWLYNNSLKIKIHWYSLESVQFHKINLKNECSEIIRKWNPSLSSRPCLQSVPRTLLLGSPLPSPTPGGCRAGSWVLWNSLSWGQTWKPNTCPLGGATQGWLIPLSPWGQVVGCPLPTPPPVPPIPPPSPPPFCCRSSMTCYLVCTKCIQYCQVLVILISAWYKF